MSKRTWSNDDLIIAIKNSTSLQETCNRLGLSTYGANSRTVKKYIAELGLDTAHFLSKAEALALARGKVVVLTDEELFSLNSIDRKHVKARFMKRLDVHECALCGITTWNNKPLTLHLDHVNGNSNDNNLANLRLLCPNCHSQTPTYCGRNLRVIHSINLCCDCNVEIHRKSTRCVKCASNFSAKFKIQWKSISELQALVDTNGYAKTGRMLGISGNAIKKHLRKYGATSRV